MALKHLLAGVALIGSMAQPALAQSQDTTGQQQQQQPTQAEQQLAQEDVEFATKAAQGGDQNGQYYAVLSVGGFLGIGEKKVAVPLDELQLREDQVYLMAAATEEQLEQMPEYDEQQFRPYAEQQFRPYAEQQGLLQE